jgi:hypothetical protein
MANFVATVKQHYAIKNRGVVVVVTVDEGVSPQIGTVVHVYPPDGRTLTARIAGYAPASSPMMTDILLEGVVWNDTTPGTRLVA